MQERTEWHRVVIFGRTAEVAERFLKKGAKVYIEGQLQTRKWEDNQTGQERYTTEVVIRPYRGEMTMLDSRGGGSGMSESYDQGSSYGSGSSQGGGQSGGQSGGQQSSGAAPDFDDEIPF